MEFDLLAAYVNYSLTWIGFGTVLGLLALVLVPGKDQGGAIATVLMGVAGAMFGCLILQYFSDSQSAVQPISTHGFVVGAGGSIVLLLFYKVLGGHLLIEGNQTLFRHRRNVRRSRFQSNSED